MNNEHFKPKQIFPVAILLWLILWGMLGSMFVQSSINSARNEFNISAMNLFHLVSGRIKTNETVVEGFAASVDAIGEINSKKIRVFARQMLKRYPHIFMFEIIEKVDKKNKAAFEKDFQNNISPYFKIRSFGYEADRQWHVQEKKNFYMPITFMEPFPPESRAVLGLDVSSNKIFTESLRVSAKLHMPVATRPFTLVEGKLAYLLHRPIKEGGDDTYNDENGMANRYVILVILAKSLLENMPEEMPNYGIKLYYGDFGPNDKKGYLYNKQEPVQSWFDSLLFPNLSTNMPLHSKTQPFVLVVKKQLGWSIFNVWIFVAFVVVAGISFYFLLKYLRLYRKSELNRAQEADHLFYLANHDSLTGLANRNLLLDRLQHALTQAKRRNSKLAVLFLDLDEFKNINDKYGHDIGDKLLTSVSERLLACIRSGDTLARRSGDEFVLILENIDDVENIHKVIETIYQAFEQKFSLGEIELTISVAVGYSVYPDDATSEENLLTLADKRMYENKRHP